MKRSLTMLAVIVAVLLFLCIIPIFVLSQEIAGIVASGECRDFTVTVLGDDIGESCWDVKLDVPGSVKDGDSWRSSFYYIDKAICWPDDRADITIKLDSADPVIQATAKMRQGSVVIEKDFSILQSCPQPLPDQWVLIVAFAVILVFGWSLAWWWKRK
jgi:hypothetical protein